MPRLRVLRAFTIGLALAVAVAGSAAAQSLESFYRGKTVTLLIGTEPGGAYDLYARLLARHLGRHIPGNPAVVAQNMPGAASMVLAGHLYSVAARDGLVLGAVQRGMPFNPLYTGEESAAARFDATKFTWIGSVTPETGIALAMTRSGITRFDQLLEQELIVGAEGGGTSDSELFARLTNAVLGTRLRIVTGYKGSTEVLLAMEKGEVNGQFNGGWTGVRNTIEPWLKQGKATLLVQLAVRADPIFATVPLIMDFAKTDAQRRILTLAFTPQLWGRPYVAPPGLPPERAAALRTAFLAALADPDLLAEAKAQGYEVKPLAGEEMARIIADAYAAPPDIIRATRAAFRGEKQ
jgi:tripartite-type tricarboxylate transporter receptor subunit TctC